MESGNTLNTIALAFQYVTERYIFNEKVYPELGHLPQPFHVKFAIRHVMDHIEKWIPSFRDKFPVSDDLFRKAFGSPLLLSYGPEYFREATVKILLNLLQLSYLVGITGEELGELEIAFQIKKTQRELVTYDVDLLDLISDIREVRAKACEKADHGAPLHTDDLKVVLLNVWGHVFYFFDEKKLPLPIVWNMIPDCMKSR